MVKKEKASKRKLKTAAKKKKEAKKKEIKEKEEETSSLKIHKPLTRKVLFVYEDVPEQFVFYVHDGTILKNLNDLIKALDKMTDDIFYYHANKEKNDFSNWIRDIINEPLLSKVIVGKNRLETKREIINYLKKKNCYKGIMFKG
ncbi:MAG: hypothetical protein N3D84_01370 [Candidatus Woesearchaeota archaeon]|nr:hypothetical protein [Candidatus Woesearchaeota archaeon]